ncbi:MAG TPA: ABC transporter substrate-binding protein [Actinomycetota bacterium]|nr:ABC transporter substrate-binding protein [Actinomycetota bacterium]
MILRSRAVAVVAVVALAGSACSASRPISRVTSKRGPKATPAVVIETAAPTEVGAIIGPGAERPTGAAEGAAATAARKASAARVVAKPGEKPTVTIDPATGIPVANLFNAQEDTVGISSSEIKLCMHAAFALGDLFNNKKEDEDVYWRMINAEQNGVFGRRVKVQFEDDAYSPDVAIRAADSCKANGNALMMSGVGFDQIPRVREWAETNRQLYFHSMATEDGAQNKNFSFAMAPTLQTVGRQIAQFIATRHPGKKVAVISRNSPNWDGSLVGFNAEMARRGIKVEATHKTNNGDDYNVVIDDLKVKCPASQCVLFSNENVINFAKMYQQAENAPHNYRPRWFNYGFQLTNDTIGESTASAPAVQTWWPTPAFDLNNTTGQPWFGEIQAMKAAYDKHCKSPCDKSSSELNDVDWMFWLGWKSLHKLLTDCGKDCTRNKIAGILLNGYRPRVDPLCEADFSRGTRHFGGHKTNIYEAVRGGRTPTGQPGALWKQIETCQEGF